MANADEGFLPLYQLIDRPGKKALAVSGGSDSTALMVLAAQYAEKVGRLSDLFVLSVDHGLRDSSHGDALTVCAWAKARGLNSHILQWRHEEITSQVQEKARAGRYRLMAKWCQDNDFDAIITAHHLEDQAETLLMRLARGSGLDGLSAMAVRAEIYGVVVYRPLLEVPRARLKQVLRDVDQNWLEDPANENDKFERVRVREAMTGIVGAGVEAQSMAISAKRLGRARRALEVVTSQFVGEAVSIFETGYCEINRAMFDEASEEIRLRALDRLITWAGGGEIAVRMAKLERLSEALAAYEGEKHTLAGARLVVRKKTLLIGREYGRIDPGLQKGVMQWDNRFRFDQPRDVQPYGLFIADDKRVRPPEMPHFVACSLPAVVSSTGGISVPHLDGNQDIMCRKCSKPR